ncbi:MAG TPA: hypothetical protein DCZ10_12370 [Pelotomaculum sp.]|nr:hypothetical protein [Pelotomaculum sp.]
MRKAGIREEDLKVSICGAIQRTIFLMFDAFGMDLLSSTKPNNQPEAASIAISTASVKDGTFWGEIQSWFV